MLPEYTTAEVVAQLEMVTDNGGRTFDRYTVTFDRPDMWDDIEAARLALERPQNFAYYGDLDQSDGWGRAFGQSRDSDALERSNWEVITADLLARFPDDFAIERSSHWAVGWVDEGRVRVLRDPSAAITDNNLTEAFAAVLVWKRLLDEYPVADEMHWSELEWEMNHPDDGHCYSEDPDCSCGLPK